MWQRNPEVLWRPVMDGAMVLDRSSTTPLSLGGMAALVWIVLDEPAGTAEIVEELRRSGMPMPEDLDRVVDDSLVQLHQHALVTRVVAGARGR